MTVFDWLLFPRSQIPIEVTTMQLVSISEIGMKMHIFASKGSTQMDSMAGRILLGARLWKDSNQQQQVKVKPIYNCCNSASQMNKKVRIN